MRTVRIRKTKYGFEIEYISADGKHVGCAGFSGFATGDMADSAAKWCDQTPDPTVEEKELTNCLPFDDEMKMKGYDGRDPDPTHSPF